VVPESPSHPLHLAPRRGAVVSTRLTGGLRFAATTGYFLATLWVAIGSHVRGIRITLMSLIRDYGCAPLDFGLPRRDLRGLSGEPCAMFGALSDVPQFLFRLSAASLLKSFESTLPIGNNLKLQD